MSKPQVLIPVLEALRRCGLKHRNSLPVLRKEVGPPIKRGRLNYYLESEIDEYIGRLARERITG